MSLFQKKIPAKRITLLREAVNLRRELEKIIEEAKKIWPDAETSFNQKIIKSLAKYDIPMIDLFGGLKDNEFLKSYGNTFVPHVKEYIDLLKQEKYNEAVELNKQYFQV